MFRSYAGAQPDFLALAPWVVRRSRRGRRCGAVGAALGPGSGSRLENDYLETALIADLPFPVDRARADCVGGDGPQWRAMATDSGPTTARHAKCSSSPSSSDTGRSHVGHHHRASIGVPHAAWRGAAGLLGVARTPAREQSQRVGELAPGGAQLVDEPRRALGVRAGDDERVALELRAGAE